MHLARLGRFVAELDPSSIPAGARRAAKLQLADMVAAVRAAARAHEIAPVREAVRAFASSGAATVLATGDRIGPVDAAFANAAYSMAQDFDDIVWMGHTCHSAVFASLAVAEHERATTSELVLAIVVANELGGRLGASSLLGPLNGQMWTFIHLVGAAAATARLLRLDAERTTHALAIALAQPNFALQPGFLLPGSKLLAAATPTATGIQAAYLARAGMTGYPGLLEDRRGFWSRFAFVPLPKMLGDLGEAWVMETLAFKTFPGCHYFQTALTAVERLRARMPFEAKELRAITVHTTQLAREATRFASEYVESGGLSPVAVNFSLPLSIAVLVSAGRLSPHELDSEWLASHAEELRALAQRIDVRHDPELTARVVACAAGMSSGRAALRALRASHLPLLARRYRAEYRSRLVSAREAWSLARAVATRLRGAPRGGPVVLPFPNRVTIELRDGRRETAEVDLPVGTCSLEGAEAELARKLGDQLGADPRPMLSAILGAEEHALEDLVRALCGP